MNWANPNSKKVDGMGTSLIPAVVLESLMARYLTPVSEVLMSPALRLVISELRHPEINANRVPQ